MERKTFALDLKATDPEQGIIEGYASVFSNVDDQGDIVAPGAFKRTISERGVAGVDVFIGHDWRSLPVGTPLALSEDEHGLFTRTKVFDTTAGRDVFTVVKELAASQNGKRLGMSIGYEVKSAEFEERDGREVRVLKDIELFEYSFLSMPANDLARVTGAKQQDDKAAIAAHSTPTDNESSWDGPATVREAPNTASVLRFMHAWRDAEGDADLKGTYKFPHHKGRGPAVIRGVNNALARLSSAQIDDKAGVERHLRKHRRDAGLEEAMGEVEFYLACKEIVTDYERKEREKPEARLRDGSLRVALTEQRRRETDG